MNQAGFVNGSTFIRISELVLPTQAMSYCNFCALTGWILDEVASKVEVPEFSLFYIGKWLQWVREIEMMYGL